MSTGDLERAVEAAWEARDTLSPASGGVAADAVETALTLLDSGEARVAEKQGDDWIVNQWLKKAVLLSFPSQRHGNDSGRAGGRYTLVRQGAVQVCRLG